MRAAEVLRELERRKGRGVFFKMYPDDDTTLENGKTMFSRHKYPKHMEFFRVGAQYRERCIMAANRVGKTYGIGAYEMTCHLTGIYPPWWEGRRFTQPVKAWAAGKATETTRDIIQAALMGDMLWDRHGRRSFDGTGMVPYNLIGTLTFKRASDLIDTVKIRHKTGGWSTLGFKTYEQGRGSFEGTAQHVIWLDEECPMEIYGECLIRTATTHGIVMLTFTPLDGMTETVLQFLPQTSEV